MTAILGIEFSYLEISPRLKNLYTTPSMYAFRCVASTMVVTLILPFWFVHSIPQSFPKLIVSLLGQTRGHPSSSSQHQGQSAWLMARLWLQVQRPSYLAI